MKTVFVVQGYEMQTPEGQLMNITTLEVFAKTEKKAIQKAKKYITKKFYRVSKIIEIDKE